MSLWPLLLAINIHLGLERPDVEFRVFQFPADRIPRIDGQADDWEIVPDTYVVGTTELRETVIGSVGEGRDRNRILASLDELPECHGALHEGFERNQIDPHLAV